MGTKLIQQRRGKGSPTYRAPSHRYFGAIGYPTVQPSVAKGEVIDIVNSRGHSAPLAYVEFENGHFALVPAVQGLKVGDNIEAGTGAAPTQGSIVQLKDIPAGVPISALEKTPGGDAELVRASGSAARIVGKDEGKVIIQLPSKKRITLNDKCRALVGKLAGSGRKDKPFVKAGKKMLAMRAKNKLYPRTSGVAMNVCDHPFGGTHRRTKGKSKSVSRDAPPGRKVGHIASRRSGRLKR
tara:strand:- start:242 stop:958 length:717 start_codon:yes stop_codon:yes gene_type:complete